MVPVLNNGAYCVIPFSFFFFFSFLLFSFFFPSFFLKQKINVLCKTKPLTLVAVYFCTCCFND